MLIAHLTDLHVTGGVALEDQAEDLARVVDRVLEARPDLVTLTGDYYGRQVPHHPTLRERAVLEPHLVRLAQACPVVALGGNHDHGEALGLVRQLGGLYPIQVLERAGSKLVHTPAGPVRVYWLAYPTKRWLLASSTPGVLEARAMAQERLATLLKAWGNRMARQRLQEPDTPIVALGHFQVTGSTLSSGEVLATGEIEVGRDSLAGLPVDYGALGHVHARQEVAPAWWYAGNPWPCDFGEHGRRGFHLVTVGEGPARVEFVDSGHREWVTLRYRWAADRDSGEPRWIERPTDAEIEAVRGQVVRPRLIVPDVHAASCPWEAELDRLEAVAHRVKRKDSRQIEPTIRVRAPEVANADTLEDKIRAWWGTLESPPEDQDRAAALTALADLQELEDEDLAADTRRLVLEAKGRPAA